MSTIEADTLTITAGAAITVFEADGVIVTQAVSTTHAAVRLQSGGTMTLDGAISVVGNATINLVTTSGALIVNEALVSDTGDVTVRGGAGLTMSAQGDVTTNAGNVLLAAGTGGMDMTGETVVNAGTGTITMTAGGAILLGKLRTSNEGVLSITSGGVLDVAEGTTDIIASNATLMIRAEGGIGENGNPIETQVRVLDFINKGFGAVFIEDVDDLILTRVDQQAAGQVSIIARQGSILISDNGVHATTALVSLYAGYALTVDASVITAGGSVILTAEDGDITLGAGVHVVGAGDVSVRAMKGALVNDPSKVGWLTRDDGRFNPELSWVLSQGKFTMDELTGKITTAGIAAHEIPGHLANGIVLRDAGGPMLQTTGGNLTIAVRDAVGQNLSGFKFSPLSIIVDANTLTVSSSDRDEVVVLATGSIQVFSDAAASGSRGGETDVSSLNGEQQIVNAMDASGKDITIRSNQVSIAADVRSAGATLTFMPTSPTAAIVLGDVKTSGSQLDPNNFHLSNTSLSHLQDGFSQIVIGSDTSSNKVYLGESGVGGSINLTDTLVIKTPIIGGHVFINQDIVLTGNSSFVIEGSGHTTDYAANVTSDADVSVLDSTTFAGNRTITAGTDGTGSIQLGGNTAHFVSGNGDGTPDTLTLLAPDNIII